LTRLSPVRQPQQAWVPSIELTGENPECDQSTDRSEAIIRESHGGQSYGLRERLFFQIGDRQPNKPSIGFAVESKACHREPETLLNRVNESPSPRKRLAPNGTCLSASAQQKRRFDMMVETNLLKYPRTS